MPALCCSYLLPDFFSLSFYSVWNLSAVVQLRISQPCFSSLSTPSLAFAPTLAPDPSSPSNRLSTITTKSKITSRFLGLAQRVWVCVRVCVCHSPPLSTGGLVGNAAKYFWFRGREGCWLRLVGVAVFVLLCFLDNRFAERYLFTPPNHWHTFRANLSLYLARSHFHKSARAQTAPSFLTGTECAREELKSKLLLKGQ